MKLRLAIAATILGLGILGVTLVSAQAADYQTKPIQITAVQFDASKPLPPGVEVAYTYTLPDGDKVPIHDTDWIVAISPEREGIVPNEVFVKQYETSTVVTP